MEINSFKARALAVLSSTAIIATMMVAAPAHAALVGPICDGISPIQTCVGTTTDDAPFVMKVPANFKGTVALYSHGYRYNVNIPVGIPFVGGYTVTNTPEPMPEGNLAIAGYLFSQGVAIMGSGFSRQGWNLDAAVQSNVELVGLFKDKFPTTKRVVAWGNSLGGIITQTLAEKYPMLVDAVAPMCMPDNIAPQLTGAGDFLWGMKTLFDPTIKGGNYSAGAAGNGEAFGDIIKVLTVMASLSNPANLATGAWPATSSATGKALEAAKIPSRSAVLLLGLMTGIPTQSAHFDSVSGPSGALKSLFPIALSPALAIIENGATAAILAILVTQDIELQAGGAVFDNSATDYTARVVNERVVFNAALSGESAIDAMLGALSPANPGAPRATASASAVAKMGTLAATTGKVNVPTIMMVGVADPVTPAGATQRIADLYLAQYQAERAAGIAAAKKSRTLASPKNKLAIFWGTTPKSYTTFNEAGSPITTVPAAPGTDHCNFSTKQYLAVAKAMLSAASKGEVPGAGEMATAARRAGNLSTDKFFRAPLLKFYNEQ